MMRKKSTQEKRQSFKDEDSADIDTTEWEPPRKRMRKEPSSSYFNAYQERPRLPVPLSTPSKPPKAPKSDLDILCEMADVLYNLEVKPGLEARESPSSFYSRDESDEQDEGGEMRENDAVGDDSGSLGEPILQLPVSLPRETTIVSSDPPHPKFELQQKLHQHQIRAQQAQFQTQFSVKPPNPKPERKPYVPTLQRFNYPQQDYFHSYNPYPQQPYPVPSTPPQRQTEQPKVQHFQQRLQFHQSYPYHFNKQELQGRKDGAGSKGASKPV